MSAKAAVKPQVKKAARREFVVDFRFLDAVTGEQAEHWIFQPNTGTEFLFQVAGLVNSSPEYFLKKGPK